jgi:hypothetical protein
MQSHTFRGLRLCPRCGKRIGFIDWGSHAFSEHMSPEEQEDVRRQIRERAEKRKTQRVEMTDDEAVEMFRKLERGE